MVFDIVQLKVVELLSITSELMNRKRSPQIVSGHFNQSRESPDALPIMSFTFKSAAELKGICCFQTAHICCSFSILNGRRPELRAAQRRQPHLNTWPN